MQDGVVKVTQLNLYISSNFACFAHSLTSIAERDTFYKILKYSYD